MTIDYVTSLHPIYSPLALLLYACSPPQFYFVPGMGAICMSVGTSQKPLFKPGKFQCARYLLPWLGPATTTVQLSNADHHGALGLPIGVLELGAWDGRTD